MMGEADCSEKNLSHSILSITSPTWSIQKKLWK